MRTRGKVQELSPEELLRKHWYELGTARIKYDWPDSRELFESARWKQFRALPKWVADNEGGLYLTVGESSYGTDEKVFSLIKFYPGKYPDFLTLSAFEDKKTNRLMLGENWYLTIPINFCRIGVKKIYAKEVLKLLKEHPEQIEIAKKSCSFHSSGKIYNLHLKGLPDE